MMDTASAETLECVERLLREGTTVSTGRLRAVKQRLTEAGVLATTPLDRKHQDPATVAAARVRAGAPLSHYVTDELR